MSKNSKILNLHPFVDYYGVLRVGGRLGGEESRRRKTSHSVLTEHEDILELYEKNCLAAKVLDESIYVDDCVAGAESVKDILKLQQDLISLLEKGGFDLRKWASNCSELLSAVKAIDPQMPLTFDSDGPSFVKVLGLQCHP